MEAFPFVFSHPLEPVHPCFEYSYEDFLSDFVENPSCEVISVRDVVFGEFSLDITKEEEVI
jgi:hypothetical protein